MGKKNKHGALLLVVGLVFSCLQFKFGQIKTI